MDISISDLGAALNAEVVGDGAIIISRSAEPQDATPTCLAIATKPEFTAKLADGQARAALLAQGTDWQSLGLEAAILVDRPRYALSALSKALDGYWRNMAPGVHPTAYIDETATIGDGAAIGPYVVIGAGAQIGADAQIAAHSVLDQDASVGAYATLGVGVKIGKAVTIGDRFIAHAGAVVGADGFSFVTPEQSGVEKARSSLGDAGEDQAQTWARIHSLGAVSVGDDVEIGANVAIDRGTIRDTRIGNRTKLDNLVHIGHNVVIGEDCLICAQVGIAGSALIGNNVVMAGQCGVSDNIRIGDNVIAGGATKMFANVPAGRVILGTPAVKMEQQIKINKAVRRLPRLFEEVAKIKNALADGISADNAKDKS
ncbi:MAG: UDP-3-O-(3-hydroxymyristoyl)glucosamine N-acyltransferase [Planktomarina sp.]